MPSRFEKEERIEGRLALGAEKAADKMTREQQVSVVVPVFNAEETLESCLRSLLSLTYPRERIEIIAINNNSSDGSAGILQRYRNSIRVLEETTQGAAAARNRGVRSARFDLIAFTDADCTVDPEWLGHLLEPLRRDPGMAAAGGRILCRRPANSVEKFGEVVHDHARAIGTFVPPYVITMNMAIRRAVLLDVGLFDESFLRGQDSDLSYRLYQKKYRLEYAPFALVYHRNESNLMGLFLEGFVHGMWDVKLKKKHADWLFPSRARIRYRDYLNLLKLFLTFLSQTFCRRRIALQKLCEFCFSLGKKAGMIVGSVRFRELWI